MDFVINSRGFFSFFPGVIPSFPAELQEVLWVDEIQFAPRRDEALEIIVDKPPTLLLQDCVHPQHGK